jgi:uncharacterized glyoxalase superfamily protein PhnB
MDGPGFTPAVFYKDPLAAVRWLEAAFGFEVAALILDGEDRLVHSEITFQGGSLNVGGEWQGAEVGSARMRSPASVEGINTQFLRIFLADGLDAHCERARAAGATIVAEPADQFYGDRVYRAVDPEGHVWNFAQRVAAFDPEAMERDMGLKMVTSLPEA